MCDIKEFIEIDEHHFKTVSGVGNQSWFYDEFLQHRLDGPAYIGKTWNGTEFVPHQEWWYMGKKIDCSTQEEFERIIKMKVFW